MQRSMPEKPLVRSLFDSAFLRTLKEGLSASDYAEFVRWWNSRLSTGTRGSARSNENSSE